MCFTKKILSTEKESRVQKHVLSAPKRNGAFSRIKIGREKPTCPPHIPHELTWGKL
jgi:hypothetical protein